MLPGTVLFLCMLLHSGFHDNEKMVARSKECADVLRRHAGKMASISCTQCSARLTIYLLYLKSMLLSTNKKCIVSCFMLCE